MLHEDPESIFNDMMKRTCDVCGNEAIGIQCLGCCSSTVCEKHADAILQKMKPGEKKDWGACYFLRFEEDASENR